MKTAAILLLALLGGCTFVLVNGDANHMPDVGGDITARPFNKQQAPPPPETP